MAWFCVKPKPPCWTPPRKVVDLKDTGPKCYVPKPKLFCPKSYDSGIKGGDDPVKIVSHPTSGGDLT